MAGRSQFRNKSLSTCNSHYLKNRFQSLVVLAGWQTQGRNRSLSKAAAQADPAVVPFSDGPLERQPKPAAQEMEAVTSGVCRVGSRLRQ